MTDRLLYVRVRGGLRTHILHGVTTDSRPTRRARYAAAMTELIQELTDRARRALTSPRTRCEEVNEAQRFPKRWADLEPHVLKVPLETMKVVKGTFRT
ncbi:hypothetical protein ACFORH_07430 [Amycolatopsis roodepoortensis]|uniref:Uncharacterized protein n=1 Tax=Amycolatopsis roodepoortensis TaxID=700274 RepID=A0ABR9L9Z3_9PSEU|nr:hypothetical protein [Amycolatopsis roodepoortensis]MBE1576988.1 hypothetical protein [Amycolatopsis roodepoortensis]